MRQPWQLLPPTPPALPHCPFAQMPDPQAPVEQVPVEQVPLEQAPVEQVPLEQAPELQFPVEQPLRVLWCKHPVLTISKPANDPIHSQRFIAESFWASSLTSWTPGNPVASPGCGPRND